MTIEDVIFYAAVFVAIAAMAFFGVALSSLPLKRKSTLVYAPVRVPRVVQPHATEPE